MCVCRVMNNNIEEGGHDVRSGFLLGMQPIHLLSNLANPSLCIKTIFQLIISFIWHVTFDVTFVSVFIFKNEK